MSLGIPTVASDFGGNTEMVFPYENGLVFRCDDHHSLALAIDEILSSNQLYERLCVGARRIFERDFSLEKMISKYSQIYKRAAFGQL